MKSARLFGSLILFVALTSMLFATDTTAPSTPTGLTSSSTGTTSFTLSWTASTDNVGVTAYEVMKDSTSLGTTSSTSMSVTGLTAAVAYGMKVRARDAAGNWSSWSTVLTVTADPSGDADSDGISNEQETLLGTNKTTAATTATSAQISVKITTPR